MRIFKLLTLFSLLFLSIFSAPLTVLAQLATPTPTPTQLGGMDLNGYCANQQLGNASLNGTTWDCSGNNQPINMNAACVWQYNNQNAFAQETSTNNPYSYQCYTTSSTTPTPTPTPTGTVTPTPTPTVTMPTPTPTPKPVVLGGMNLDGWCQSIGEVTAGLNATNQWVCTGNNQVINFAANPTPNCVWQYGNQNAYASNPLAPTDPNYKYQWSCSAPTNSITPTPTASPTPSVQPTRLGGMDLNGYCASIGEGTASLNTANQWVCTNNNQIINFSTNPTPNCVWQYNNPNAYALNPLQPTNPNYKYAWACYAPGSSITTTPTPTPTQAPSDDWNTYKYNAQRSSFNPQETTINASDVTKLVQKLNIPCQTASCNAQVATPGAVLSDEPAVVNNVMFYGDWTGNFYAKNVKDGSIIWTINLGTMTPPASHNCSPKSVGVVSSASVQTETINGTQTEVVYITGADGNMYAINAATGTVIWKTLLANPAIGGLLWDSPAIANGSVYVGVASFGDCPLVQGQEYRLDATTGAIQAQVNLVPNGCVGAGEWSSPTYDPSDNKIYIATGTQDNSCKVNGQPFVEPNALAVVELDGTTLQILGSWRIPASEQGPDSDFGVSPVLATATINGVSTPVVEAANKNGHAYIFKRDAISQGPIDDLTLAPGGGGTCPDCSMGTISTAATDGTTIYQGMGFCNPSQFSNCAATGYNSEMIAINPNDGSIIWKTLIPKQIVSTPILLKDVLIVFTGNNVGFLSRTDGHIITNITPPGAGSVLDGSGAVARGQLFFGDLNGNFYEYGF